MLKQGTGASLFLDEPWFKYKWGKNNDAWLTLWIKLLGTSAEQRL